MTSSLFRIYTICFILVQLIFAQPTSKISDIAQADSAVMNRMPEELIINMNCSNGEPIEIKWKKDNHFLANDYLPIVVPFDEMHSNVMDDVGKFVVYHDHVQSSAVVYFQNLNALFGVVGLDYYIYNLPFQFNREGIYELGIVGEPYLIKYQLPLTHILPDVLNISSAEMIAEKAHGSVASNDSTKSKKRPADCCSDAGPSARRQCPDTRRTKVLVANSDILGQLENREYYLEILVFVLSDIVDTFKLHYGETHYIQWLIRYYVIYFNTIDMFFRKLGKNPISLYLNIAKIVIEDDLLPFNFLTNNEFHFSNVLQNVSEYLKTYEKEYPRDSFDCIFIHTGQRMLDATGRVKGITRNDVNLYEARKQNQFYEVVPITVVAFSNEQANYVVALHEIGRIIGLKIDSQNKGLTEVRQCNTIMQRGGAKCSSCLHWSDQSILEYHQFFSKNLNRCFMLNKPRSLQPPGINRFTTPHRQCLCFGFDAYLIEGTGTLGRYVKTKDCSRPMQCANKKDGNKCHFPTVVPFDGTPCMAYKVCWEGKCEYSNGN